MGRVTRSQRKNYQIWVSLEKWDGDDDKINDIETLKVAEVSNIHDGTIIFQAVQTMAIAVLDVVPVKNIE